jgi:hypothetical protein
VFYVVVRGFARKRKLTPPAATPAE